MNNKKILNKMNKSNGPSQRIWEIYSFLVLLAVSAVLVLVFLVLM